MIYHPEVATRSCEDCKKWLYNSDGTRSQRGGQDVLRVTPTPCLTPAGCPKKSPEEAKDYELSEKNRTCFQFYLRSKGIDFKNLEGELAQDQIIQRNFSIINSILEKKKQEDLAKMIGNSSIK
jgi:hypothetical protein